MGSATSALAEAFDAICYAESKFSILHSSSKQLVDSIAELDEDAQKKLIDEHLPNLISLLQDFSPPKDMKKAAAATLKEASAQVSRDPFPYAKIYKCVNHSINKHVARSEKLQRHIRMRSGGHYRQDIVYHHMGWDGLVEAAQVFKTRFDELITRVKDRLRVKAEEKLPPLKGKHRAEVKANVTYGGDVSNLTDVVRGTLEIQCEEAPDPTRAEEVIAAMYDVVESLLDMPGIHILEFKDRYQNPMSGGYMDMSLKLSVDGFVCELQLNLSCVLKIKESPEGHGAYEDERLANDNMMFAAMKNRKDFEEKLEKAKHVEVKDMYMLRPLHYVAAHGNVSAVTALLERGANPIVFDKMGMLPLHRPLLRGHFEVVDCIVSALERTQRGSRGVYDVVECNGKEAKDAALRRKMIAKLLCDCLERRETLGLDRCRQLTRRFAYMYQILSDILRDGWTIWHQWAEIAHASVFQVAIADIELQQVLGPMDDQSEACLTPLEVCFSHGSTVKAKMLVHELTRENEKAGFELAVRASLKGASDHYAMLQQFGIDCTEGLKCAREMIARAVCDQENELDKVRDITKPWAELPDSDWQGNAEFILEKLVKPSTRSWRMLYSVWCRRLFSMSRYEVLRYLHTMQPLTTVRLDHPFGEDDVQVASEEGLFHIIDSQGRSLLHHSVATNRLELSNRLLDHIPVNTKDDHGRHPLDEVDDIPVSLLKLLADTNLLTKLSRVGGKRAHSGVVHCVGTGKAGSSLREFNYPNGVAPLAEGGFLMADGDNHRILRFEAGSTEGTIVAGTAKAGSSLGELKFPRGVKLLAEGGFLVVDRGNHRILRFEAGAAEGTLVAGTGKAGSNLGELRNPFGVAPLAEGGFLVADHGNHRILRFEAGATEGTIVAGTGKSGSGLGELHNPFGVAPLGEGGFLVPDQGNHRILRFEAGATEGIIVAGTGKAGSSLGELHNPLGLAPLADGGFLVADSDNHRILRFEAGATEGIIVAGTGKAGGSLAELHKPRDVAPLTEGGFLVADADNHRILRFDAGAADGTIVAGIGKAGSSLGELHYPVDVAPLAEGGFLMADYGNHRILRFEAGATEGTIVAGTGKSGTDLGELKYPRGVTPLAEGGFLVADRDNHRILRFEASATEGTIFAGTGNAGSSLGELNCPLGVAPLAEGGFLVVDQSNHRILRFEAGATEGIIVAGTGKAGSSLGELHNPFGVAPIPEGGFFVADRDNHRILRFEAGATEGTIVAGTGKPGSSLGELQNPVGVAPIPQAGFLVADRGNHRILRFEAGATEGTIVAGTGKAGSSLGELHKATGVALLAEGGFLVADTDNHRILRFETYDTEGAIVADVGNAALRARAERARVAPFCEGS